MAIFSMIKVLLLCATSLLLLLNTPVSGQIISNNLLSGQRLNSNKYLKEGSNKLIMQNDCNLVLYNEETEIWSSETANKGACCFLTLQSSGNLAIYDNNNRAVWTTNIDGLSTGYYVLILQKNNKVVVYGPSIWTAGADYVGLTDDVVAVAHNGTVKVSDAKHKKVVEMGKIMEVMNDE